MKLRSRNPWTVRIASAALLFSGICQAQQRVVDVAKATAPAGVKPDTRSTPTITPQYTIGSGDVLNIQVWKEKELSQTVVVRPDGKVSLPLLGEIAVIGKEPSQLEELIQTRLASMVVQPRVTVTVLEIHSRMVYITGEVSRPGAYPLNAPITVLQLIAQAGGLTEFASKKKIHVVRASNTGSEIWLNYKALIQGSDPNRNLQLNPGDTVVIP
ncbi:polysaccharide biosynthesis/export family protein [Terriglobus tenax]|uniref:polysaccharide biosynthesis/export family protein n=1 Tax=Terriglobus tenax TaxID=1111115 RepID=UPI0021E0649B|nr:polysaccharide export protein [Terriglobus tenax]